MTRILLTGRTGQVGWELARELAPLGEVVALGRAEMDLTRPDSIREAVRARRPDVIVNAAGYTNVDKAESEPQLAHQVNGVAPGVLAEEARRCGALLVHYSTDYVFDGTLDRPYLEEDRTNPVNEYGKSKLAGERGIEAAGGAYVILRTSWIYSSRGANFVLTILRLARERPELAVVQDQIGSPTWARALARATAELLAARDRGAGGIYHLAAAGVTSRYDFTRAIIETARELSGLAGGWATVRPIGSDQYPLPARRPPNPATSKDKVARVYGVEMPRWEIQLRQCLQEIVTASDWRSRAGAPPVT